MDTQGTARSDKILVLEAERNGTGASAALAEYIPTATVENTASLQRYEESLRDADYDLVVLDCDLPALCNSTEVIHKLKLQDHEPAVLVVASSTNPRVIADMYSSGCHRYLVKDDDWLLEVGQAARHLLRVRRLEDENHRLLAKLTEANKLLEDKNRRLDEFSATIAHDIRGPLGGIAMKLDYLLEQYEQQLPDRCVRMLTTAHHSTRRLTDLVQAMYDFARLGAKAAHMGEVDTAALVQEVVADMDFEQSLDITLGLDDLPVIWGSDALLRRVFINLVGNAVKYNDKDHIVINIGLDSYHESSIARYCHIYVEDNGPGIAKEELKDIFHLFSRGAQAEKSSEGLGIGLSVVQRIVELHFGSVEVESVRGEGTKFTLILPTDKIDFIR